MNNTLDVCQTGYDYEQHQLNELENENMKLKKKLELAVEALKFYTLEDSYVSCFGNPVNPNPMVARKALKELEILADNKL